MTFISYVIGGIFQVVDNDLPQIVKLTRRQQQNEKKENRFFSIFFLCLF